MSEHERKEPIAFDEIELKSDTPIQRMEKPPIKRGQPKPARSFLTILLFLLFCIGGAAAWYFFDQHRQLELRYNSLLEEQDSTRLNLNTTAGTLEEAHASINALTKDLDASKKENEELSKKNKTLNNSLQAKNKENKTLRQEVDRGKASLSKANESNKNLTARKAELEKSYAQLEQSSNSKISSLETSIEQKDNQYRTDAEAWSATRNSLQQNLQKMTAEKERIQRQFEDESSASLEIIKAQSALKQNNTKLESEVRKLSAELKTARTKINALENVQNGDLVPYSEEVTPGEVRYREPLPDGEKIPRKIGQVAIQVLVNEVGSVEKAFILPGQLLEANLARALTQSIYKWKFTPPSYRKIRVKTWQTVLVTAE